MQDPQQPMPVQTRWHELRDAQALEDEAVARIARAAREALDTSARFSLVLAGGETPRRVYRRLSALGTDWSCWHVWFGDERCLPISHPQRNSVMAAESWLSHVPIPREQIHDVAAELGAREAAAIYARKLRGVGPFDLVLLGLGEDGHTASLFPGHDWGTGPGAPDVLAVHDAPKPPPERISLSASRLSRARSVLFLVSGAAKRDAVARWRAGEPIPAAAIRCDAGVDVLVA